MGLYDDVNLGRLADSDISDDSQEIVNAESLLFYDRNTLIKSLNYRMSSYRLEYILNNLSEDNDELFLKNLLREFVNVYSLTPLRAYLAEGYRDINLKNQLTELVKYIKIYMMEEIISTNIKRSDIDNIHKFKEKFLNLPYFLVYSLTYIDRDSYDKFLYSLMRESNMDYEEL